MTNILLHNLTRQEKLNDLQCRNLYYWVHQKPCILSFSHNNGSMNIQMHVVRMEKNNSLHFIADISLLCNYFTVFFVGIYAMLYWMKTERPRSAVCIFWYITGPWSTATKLHVVSNDKTQNKNELDLVCRKRAVSNSRPACRKAFFKFVALLVFTMPMM